MSTRPRFSSGLLNLGNSCYLASTLQCLAALPPLASFFISAHFEREVNTRNVFSTGGELSRAFAELLRAMADGGGAPVSPRAFKEVLGRIGPQFAGFGQQDSQELCNFLLDRLNEDVNRVAPQPYVPNFEANGEPDEVVAAEVLARHRRRYDSTIADLFEGLFKSQVCCPVCDKVSLTFDPFMSLALPIGAAGMRVVHVTLRERDGALRVLALELRRDATLAELVATAAAQRGLSASSLLPCEVFHHKLHKFFRAEDAIERLYDGDFIFLYEVDDVAAFDGRAAASAPPPAAGPFPLALVPSAPNGTAAPCVSLGGSDEESGSTACDDDLPAEAGDVPLVLVQLLQSDSPLAGAQHVGLPILLSVPADATGSELHDTVEAELRRYEAAPADPMDVESTRLLAGDAAPPDLNAPSRAGPRRDWRDSAAVSRASSTDGSEVEELGHVPIDAATPESSASCRGRGWVLRRTDSTYFVPSAANDGIGEPLPAGDAPAFELSRRSAGHPQYAVLVWEAAAFGPAGRYSRAALDADTVAASARPCSKSRPNEGAVTLHDCLDQFAREEVLDADNAWYCPRCKEHREGRKKLQVWSLPPLLVIHLKRFSTDRWRRKVDTRVDFPITGLDLSRHCLSAAAGEAVYDLRAVSNHYGGTSSGHYTAFTRNAETGAWHEFNDSNVSSIDPDSVCTPGAYVLIYERRAHAAAGSPAAIECALPATAVAGEPARESDSDPLGYLM